MTGEARQRVLARMRSAARPRQHFAKQRRGGAAVLDLGVIGRMVFVQSNNVSTRPISEKGRTVMKVVSDDARGHERAARTCEDSVLLIPPPLQSEPRFADDE